MPLLLEVKSLSKLYPRASSHALKDISLQISDGIIYGLMGMSGAGKSTLLRCLSGLEKPSSGEILFQGIDLTKQDAQQTREYRQQIGMIFQHFQLFSSQTVAENVAFPLELLHVPQAQITKRVDELLELVGLSNKRDRYPAQLSGGEKQRVGIARALANNPALLLCDEPTSALDPKSTQSILDLLQKLNRELNLTIVLITHQLETIKQICSRVAVLSHGTIVEEGDIRQLFIRPEHPTTKHLLHLGIEDIPPDLLKNPSDERRLVRLGFEGNKAKEPIISKLVKNFPVDINILSGGLDYLENTVIGHLLVELLGSQEGISQGIEYLQSQDVVVEVIQ